MNQRFSKRGGGDPVQIMIRRGAGYRRLTYKGRPMRFPNEGAASGYMRTVDPEGRVTDWRTMRFVESAIRPIDMPRYTPTTGGGQPVKGGR